ncbi:MAG: hypothetical protein CVU57_10265 [Deltaproteobacteria bacterium HGW-Deltaproteobacteria-15]|jgi:hypothetical protein|nr:MAG: hypothetical protein CVU57_10265 [Deltaproteobacteria bacterium HGW-Deltaproteobacteria-15]
MEKTPTDRPAAHDSVEYAGINPPPPPAEGSRGRGEAESEVPGEAAVVVLRFFAWLELVGSIVGGYLFGSQFESVYLGAAIVLQGMFFCAFFLVVAAIADSAIEIRKKICGIPEAKS